MAEPIIRKATDAVASWAAKSLPFLAVRTVDPETGRAARMATLNEDGLPEAVGIGHLMRESRPTFVVTEGAPPDEPRLRDMFGVDMDDWPE